MPHEGGRGAGGGGGTGWRGGGAGVGWGGRGISFIIDKAVLWWRALVSYLLLCAVASLSRALGGDVTVLAKWSPLALRVS